MLNIEIRFGKVKKLFRKSRKLPFLPQCFQK